MQPQGLEALMQSQPAPQMNNPRLAAAMDVVTSDAEEQILDPRTLAMLKYKDALQAMQAADQMMASAQPAPTAPTVAERTKLAAEQGIAGLAQRLSPGVQQRGGQMAAQQAQQAIQGGGLPQLPAPNMAGMAGGGIVAFADGGAPTSTKVVPRPVPMGQPNVGAQAAVSDDVARYIYNYTNLRSSMEAATDPQQKAVINQRLQEMQQTYSPDIVSEAHMKMSQQSGMAGGGIVAFAKGGGGEVEDETPRMALIRKLIAVGMPPEEAAVEADRTLSRNLIPDFTAPLRAITPDFTAPAEGIMRAATAPGRAVVGAAADLMKGDGSDSRQGQYGSGIASLPRPAPERNVPSSTYGAGDRTGQDSTLAGMGQGIASSISDAVGGAKRFITDAMSIAPSAASSREGQYTMGAGSEDQRLVDMRRSGVNPNYAEAFGGPAIPPFERLKTYLGGLGVEINDDSSLQRVVDYAKANNSPLAFKIAAYLTAMGIDTGKVYSDVGQDIGAGVQMATQQVAEGVNAAQQQAAEGVRVAQGLPPDAPVDAASTSAPTTANAAAPVAATQDAVETLLSQPASSEMGPNATPEQYFRGQFRPEKAQAERPTSAGTSDDRYDRMLAGLRGLGAQGLGGYAAGSAEEKLRMEQEAIAEQERQSRAAAEERGFNLEERNINLQDTLRRDQLAQQQLAASEMLQYRYDQLNQRQQEAVDAAVNEETAMLRQSIQVLDSQIPNLKDGLFSSDLSDAVAERASLMQQLLAARARILGMYDDTQYGSAQAGAAGLAPGDEALVTEYLNR